MKHKRERQREWKCMPEIQTERGELRETRREKDK